MVRTNYVASLCRSSVDEFSLAARQRGALLILVLIIIGLLVDPVLAQTPPTIRVRSIGEPPATVIAEVASIGVVQKIEIAAGQSLSDKTKQICGYSGEKAVGAFLTQVKLANGNQLASADLGNAPLTAAMTLEFPTCVAAKSTPVVIEKGKGGIGSIIKSVLGYDYDSKDRRTWADFMRRLCDANKESVNCSSNLMDPILAPGILSLPAGLVVTEFVLRDVTSGPETAIANLTSLLASALRDESSTVGEQIFFAASAPEIVKPPVPAGKPTSDGCSPAPSAYFLPLGTGADKFDLAVFLKVAAEYSAYQRRFVAAGTLPQSVVTIIDTGLDDERASIQSRLRKIGSLTDSSGVPDSSGPTGANWNNDPYQASEYHFVKATDLADPDRVPTGHGTEVASLVLAETAVAAALKENPAIEGHLPWLRVFRALRSNGTKYVLDETSFEKAFEFVARRVPNRSLIQPPGMNELSVVNISLATTLSNSTDSAVASLGRLRDRTLVVVAAGNEGTQVNPPDQGAQANYAFPAGYGGIGGLGSFLISVGAARSDGRGATKDSNRSHDYVDIFAWGECQAVRGISDEAKLQSGTSFAAPWVSFTGAFLMQGPLFFPHPVNVKNRILSAVRSVEGLRWLSESGGLLDPLRTIDVLVDHLVVEQNGMLKSVRGLVDYRNSKKPTNPTLLCPQSVYLNNLARFERRDFHTNRTLWYRQRSYYQLDGSKEPRPPKLTKCEAPAWDEIITIFPDRDFEKLARNEAVQPERYKLSEIKEFVARLYEGENSADVTNFLRNDTKCVYLRTTAALGHLPERQDSLLQTCSGLN